MKALTTLLLTLSLCALSLCALSLPAFAGPSCDANADESLNVLDVVAIVGAVLGTSEAEVNCAGPGCDAAVADATSGMFTQAQIDAAVAAAVASVDITSNDAEVAADAVASVDITSDNADAIAAAMPSCDFEGGEVWYGSACATPQSSDPAPNCFLMGLCGKDGAASFFGMPGPYSQMSSSDALFEGSLCVEEYGWGLEWWWMTDVTYGPAGVCM